MQVSELALQYLILIAVLSACVFFYHGGREVEGVQSKAQGLVRARAVPRVDPASLATAGLPSQVPLVPFAAQSQSVVAVRPRPVTSVRELQPHEIALLQFDSRYPLSDYWQSSAMWNEYYCRRHGHTFIYYSLRERGVCMHDPSGERLADPWCKVKAMLQANSDFPDVQLFIYLDSDAVIDKRYENSSLVSLVSIMQDKLSWDLNARPMVFNQDGPCWWCKLVNSVGYKVCLNAGTVLWHRHPRSLDVLRDWWAAAMDEQLEGNPLRRRFRLKWPWEQDRQMAVYNRTPEHIQIASQPGQAHMDMRAGHHDWCLSHLAQSGCFISHHCENAASKKRMMAIYDSQRQAARGQPGTIAVKFL